MRYWVLLLFLVITGICLGIIGVAITVIIANLIVIKAKRTKKAKLISIIN